MYQLVHVPSLELAMMLVGFHGTYMYTKSTGGEEPTGTYRYIHVNELPIYCHTA